MLCDLFVSTVLPIESMRWLSKSYGTLLYTGWMLKVGTFEQWFQDWKFEGEKSFFLCVG